MAFAYSTSAFSQDDANDIKDGVYKWMSDHNLDTIPVIIFNEREITLEDFANIPSYCIRTYEGFLPPVSVELLGEKGKRGILYTNTKKNYVPLLYRVSDKWYDPEYYYKDGDLPAEFPGGDSALRSYLHETIKVRPELDSIFANVYVNCFFDEEGNCEKSEISHIQFVWPQVIDIKYRNGKRADTDFLSEKCKLYTDMLREDALTVANGLPRFKPATFWLQHVKYMREIRMFFVGKNAKESECKY